MTPQFSIITPSLNQAAYLREALDSVASQRGVDVEQLIFDPGSMDGSRAMLRAETDGGLRPAKVFFEPDSNAAEAINKGLDRAQGDILGWLSADDFYASEVALAQVGSAFAEHPECDIIYARSSFVNETGAIVRPGPFQIDPAKLAETLRSGEPFLSPAVFFRNRLLQRTGPLDPRFNLAFEFEFWLRAAREGATFHALDIDIGRRRLHHEALSRLMPGVRAMQCAQATRNHFGSASPAWVGKAIAADVSRGSDASALAAEAARRRLNREGVRTDVLVVLGNGPSLAGFDFNELRGVDAIGMNAAYRHWREIGWYPRFYACLDDVVGLSHREAIEAMVQSAAALGVDAFLLRDNLIQTFAPEARRSRRVINFDELASAGGLLDAVPLTTGSHAALFGALLGYEEMILLGVDCNYVEALPESEGRGGTILELLDTPSDNPNYFFSGYQVAGDRYNIPNPVPDLHLACWREVGARLAGRGVRAWNASKTSRVDAFAYRPFVQLKAGGDLAREGRGQ